MSLDARSPEQRPPGSPAPDDSPTPQVYPPGLRIALYFLLVVVLVFDTGTLLLFVWLHGIPETPAAGAPPLTIPVGWLLAVRALMAPTAIVATIGFVHFVDRKPVSTIGAGPPIRPAMWLFSLLSVAVLGLWTAAVGFLGELDISFLARSSIEYGEVFAIALGFFAAACVDEWIFRGYIFSALRERFRWTHTAGLTSILFALRQASNPQIEVAALFNMFLLGLIMAAIRELSGSLWPVAIFHGLWNFTIGCILTLPLSGIAIPGLMHTQLRGDELWTGGSYGPEASWLLTGALLVILLSLSSSLDEIADEEEKPEEDTRYDDPDLPF